MLGCQDRDKQGFIIENQSAYEFEQTIDILKDAITKQPALNQLGTIDHAKNGQDINQTIKANTVILFDNPLMATRLIDCNPSMGIDLPLRLLVSKNYQGHVHIQYTNPEYWSLKHNVKDKTCLHILSQAKILLEDLSATTMGDKEKK